MEKFRKATSRKEIPGRKKTTVPGKSAEDGLIRLNKYIANAGVCSRREADKLITAGAVTVNGKVVTELGTKVSPADKVQYGEQSLKLEKLRYVLLNKPKGFITTTDDPQERKTVMTLIAKACKERVYPVGRLDRNTTGLLLFTNDGDLTKKLLHPRHGIQKIYHVVLDKSVTKKDMTQILEGIQLEDGMIRVDAIEYIGDGKDKKQLGIELHSGKNRVVRRIFEKLNYKVIRLDRVSFAGLTKKSLPRGEWRLLDEKEISFLKMLG
jgi:23S rRNA pseudouridine2605 synthase